jgi:hypothetical protein
MRRRVASGTLWIAADAHHAVARDATFKSQDCPERCQRQRTQMQLLLGKGFVDDPACGGVHPRIGDGIVNDAIAFAFAGHRGLHAIIEDLPWRAAKRLEGGNVATQHRREVLVHHVSRPD